MPTDSLPTEADMEAADARPTTSTPVSLSEASVRAGDLAQRGLSAYTSPTSRIPADSLDDTPAPAPKAQQDVSAPAQQPVQPAPAPQQEPLTPSIPGLDSPADPVSDAQTRYAAARQAAGQSIVSTRAALRRMGFDVQDDHLIDPAQLQTTVQAKINAALASDAANASDPFGGTKRSTAAQQLRDQLANLRERASAVIGDHTMALRDLKASLQALDQTTNAQLVQNRMDAQRPGPSPAIPGLLDDGTPDPDPVGTATAKYTDARTKAATSLTDLHDRLSALGQDVSGEALLHPERLKASVRDWANTQLNSNAANQVDRNGYLTPQAEAFQQQVNQTAHDTLNALTQHGYNLQDLKASATGLQHAQNADRQRQIADQADQQRAAANQAQLDRFQRRDDLRSLPGQFPDVPHIPGLDDPFSVSANAVQGEPASGVVLPHETKADGSQAAFAPTDAPYRQEQDGSVSFDPTRLTQGLTAAHANGLLDDEHYASLLPKAAAAEHAYAEQQKLVESNPVARRLMALGHGATSGAAFLAGAPLGAEAGAAIGAFGGPLDPVTVPLGAAIGGAITGGVASWGANKILSKLGEYSDAIKSFNDAAEAHPNYDAAGNLISFGAGLPKAATSLAARGISALAPEGESLLARGAKAAANAYQKGSPGAASSISNLAEDWQNRVAQGASPLTASAATAARVGGFAGANVAVDTIIKGASHAMGLGDGQTLPGAAQAAVLGAFLSGHGITFQNISNDEAADIMARGAIRKDANLSRRDTMTPAEIAAKYPSADGVTVHALSRPLSEKETEFYNAADAQMTAAINRGDNLGPGMTVTGKQALTAGQPYGNTSAVVTPAGEPSAPGPQSPTSSTVPLLRTPETPGPLTPALPGSLSPASPAGASPTNSTVSTSGSSSPNTPVTASGQAGNNPAWNVPQEQQQENQSNSSTEAGGGTDLANVPHGTQEEQITQLQRQIADSTALQDQAKREGNSMAVALHGKEIADARNQLSVLEAQTHEQITPQEPEESSPDSTGVAQPPKAQPPISAPKEPTSAAGTVDAPAPDWLTQNAQQTVAALPEATKTRIQDLAAAGKTAKQIAGELGMDEATVRNARIGLSVPSQEIAPGQPNPDFAAWRDRYLSNNAETPQKPVSTTTPASPAIAPNAETTSHLGDAASSAPSSKAPSIPGFPDLPEPSANKPAWLMTPDEWKQSERNRGVHWSIFDPEENPHDPFTAQRNAITDAARVGEPVNAEAVEKLKAHIPQWYFRVGEHYFPGNALTRSEIPVSAVDPFGLKLPQEYVKEGDYYFREGAPSSIRNYPSIPGFPDIPLHNPEQPGEVAASKNHEPVPKQNTGRSERDDGQVAAKPKGATEGGSGLAGPRSTAAGAEPARGPEFHPVHAERKLLKAFREKRAADPTFLAADPKPGKDETGSGLYVDTTTGDIRYDKDTFARSLSTVQGNGADPSKWLDATLFEEPFHAAQVAQTGKQFKALYTKAIWNLVPEPVRAIVRQLRPEDVDANGKDIPYALGAEYERMVAQYRATGAITEGLTGNSQKNALVKQLEPFLAAPQDKTIEQHLRMLTGKPKATPAAPTKKKYPSIPGFPDIEEEPETRPKTFAEEVLDAAKASQNQFGHKAFINRAFDEWKKQTGNKATIEQFKYALTKAMQSGQLSLSRNDNPNQSDPDIVPSIIKYGNETFNHINIRESEDLIRKANAAHEKGLQSGQPKSKQVSMPEDERAASQSGQPSPSGPEARMRLLDKTIKTAHGSRYYDFDVGDQWVSVRIADHANRTENQSQKQLAATFREVTKGKSKSGMDLPHQLNIVLPEPVTNEGDATRLTREVISMLPKEWLHPEQVGNELIGNSLKAELAKSGQWTLTNEETGEEKSQSRAESEAGMQGSGQPGLATSKTGNSNETETAPNVNPENGAPTKGALSASRPEEDLPHDYSTPKFTTDELTGAPTQFTGRTVDRETAGRISDRNERVLGEVRRLVQQAHPRGAVGGVVRPPTIEEWGRVLPRLGPEVRTELESAIAKHPEGWQAWPSGEGVVAGTGDHAYKVYFAQERPEDGTKGVGIVASPVRNANGGIALETRLGSIADVVEKASVLSHLGMPTEVAGIFPKTGEVLTKQPRADIIGNYPEHIIGELDSMGAVPVRVASASEFGTWMVKVGDRHYLVSDVRGANVMHNTQEVARPIDIVLAPLNDADFEKFPELKAARDDVQPLEGDRLFSSKPQDDRDSLVGRAVDDAVEHLSKEQREVLEQIRKGKSVDEIAKSIGVQPADVKRRVEEANQALDNAREAAIKEVMDHVRQYEPSSLENINTKIKALASEVGSRISLTRAILRRAAKEGYAQGSHEHTFIERQKEEARKLTTDVINTLPPSERSKFLDSLNRVLTQHIALRPENEKFIVNLFRRAAAIGGKVLTRAEELRKEATVQAIKKTATRVADSPSVDVVYKSLIHDKVKNLDFHRPAARTVSRLTGTKEHIEQKEKASEAHAVPEELVNELDRLNKLPIRDLPVGVLDHILSDMLMLEKLGRLKVKTRAAVRESRRQFALGEIAKAKTTPLNLAPKKVAQPGEKLGFPDTFKNRFNGVLNRAAVLDRALLPMAAVADGLGEGKGNYNGPLERHVHGRIDSAYNDILVDREKLLQPVEDLIKKHNLNEQDAQRFAVYATLQQADGERRLLDQGVTPETIAKNREISPQLMEVYKAWRSIEKAIFPAVQKVAREEFNQHVAKVDHYFPMLRDHDSFMPAQAPIQTADGKEVQYDPMAMFQSLSQDFNPVPRKNVEAGFTKDRAEGAGTPIRLDGFEVMRRHVNDATHFIHMQPVLNDLSKIVSDPVFAEKYGQGGQTIYRDYLDTIARQGGVDATKRVAWLDTLRRNLGLASIGFRLASNIKHASNVGLAMYHAGPGWYAKGMRAALSGEADEWISKHMAEIKARHGAEPAQEEIETGKPVAQWAGKASVAAQKYAFYIARHIDAINAKATALGAYMSELAAAGRDPENYLHEPVDRERVNRALLRMRRAVASPNPKDQPQALTRGVGLGDNASIAKTLLAFQNVFLDQWSNLRHDFWRAGIREKNPSKALMMGLAILATTLLETGIEHFVKKGENAVTGTKEDEKHPDEFGHSFLINGLRRFPFMGQIIGAMRYGGSGIPAVDSLLVTPFKQVSKLSADNPSAQTKAKAAIDLAKTAAGVAGVPGVGYAGDLAKKLVPHVIPAKQTRESVVDAVRNGDQTAIQKALKAGVIKPEHVAGIQRDARLTALQSRVRHMPLDKAEAFYRTATPYQKREVDSVMREKRSTSKPQRKLFAPPTPTAL